MAVMSLILSVWMIRSFRAKWTNWQDILRSFGMRYFLSVKRDTKIQILSKKVSVFSRFVMRQSGFLRSIHSVRQRRWITSKKLL